MICAEFHLRQKSEITQRIMCHISRVSIIHQTVSQADSVADIVGASVAFYSNRITQRITPRERTTTGKDILCTMMKDEGNLHGTETAKHEVLLDIQQTRRFEPLIANKLALLLLMNAEDTLRCS